MSVSARLAGTRSAHKQIMAFLDAQRAGTSYSELSRQTRVSRAMLRAMDLDGVEPGADTLALLLAWDERLGPLVLSYLTSRGEALRGHCEGNP